jgi:hypothetical protein
MLENFWVWIEGAWQLLLGLACLKYIVWNWVIK